MIEENRPAFIKRETPEVCYLVVDAVPDCLFVETDLLPLFFLSCDLLPFPAFPFNVLLGPEPAIAPCRPPAPCMDPCDMLPPPPLDMFEDIPPPPDMPPRPDPPPIPPPKANAWPARDRAAIAVTAKSAVLFFIVFLLGKFCFCKEVFHDSCHSWHYLQSAVY
jgi:hypothetical protein